MPHFCQLTGAPAFSCIYASVESFSIPMCGQRERSGTLRWKMLLPRKAASRGPEDAEDTSDEIDILKLTYSTVFTSPEVVNDTPFWDVAGVVVTYNTTVTH
jgi:hypothetical protein